MLAKALNGNGNEQYSLKPCPFCGMDVAIFATCRDLEACASYQRCKSEYMVLAVCNVNAGGCGASSGFRDTCEQAADAWNGRE